jgi:DNA-binding transcriptional LysR family regulator
VRRLSLDRLRTFTYVVELGSFSAAAERLDLSQPAVSLQVRELEKHVGVRLIERVGRRAAPTAAGQELLGHARRIDADVDAALDAMARHAKGTIGRIRIGTGATACIYFLPPILRALRGRFPSLDIVVSTGNTADVLKMIEDNTLDFGLVTLPVSGRIFDVQPLIEDEFVAIAAPDAEALPGKVAPADFGKRPLVLSQAGANTRALIDQWAMRAGVALKPVMELDSVEAIKQIVGAGLGCGIVPKMALPHGQASARRQPIIRSLHPKLIRKLAIVMRRDKPLHRGLREAISAMRSHGEEFRGRAAERDGRKARHG